MPPRGPSFAGRHVRAMSQSLIWRRRRETRRMRARLVSAIGSVSALVFGACGTSEGTSHDGGGGGPGVLTACPDSGPVLDHQSCSTPNETCATTFQAPDAGVAGCCFCSTAPSCIGPTWRCLGASSAHVCPASAPDEGAPCTEPSQSGACVYCTSPPVLAGCRQNADGGSAWTRIPVGDCPVAVDGAK